MDVQEITDSKDSESVIIPPVKKNKAGKYILAVLAIYMMTFALAICVNPFLLPFFGIFATGISIIVVIIMKRQ